jgi:hypothetical protein
MAELIDRHICDENWRALVHQARQAAEHGEKEFMLLQARCAATAAGQSMRPNLVGRAPCAARRRKSISGGSAILNRMVFNFRPEYLDFPGGMPGDIGLFLTPGANEG